MMRVIDTHAHLDHLENLKAALEAAAKAGVTGIVTVGVDLDSNKKNLEVKRTTVQPKIYPALGMHPGYYKPEEIEPCIKFIRENIKEAVAIGEIGLDFWYKPVRKDKEKHRQQRELFRHQLTLAKEFNLPVVVHSRGTWAECLKTVKEFKIEKAVFHWYSGPLDVLKDIMDNGYFISATPALVYSPPLKEAVTHAPIEQTLIETDCPVTYREGDHQFQAEPKDVFKTLKHYCILKNMDEQKACVVFNQNAQAFFGIKD